MFDRIITCSVAKDNGRTKEFIKRKEYTDKSRCYECGVRIVLSISNCNCLNMCTHTLYNVCVTQVLNTLSLKKLS